MTKIWMRDITDFDTVATPQNYLINGGFDFAQRQVPANPTTIATDKYGPDRWRTSSQSASLQYSRTIDAEYTSNSYGNFTQITNAGKFMVYQIIEGVNSASLRSQKITFSVSLASQPGGKIIRMGIIRLSTAGVMDTIPETFVTAWNANTVDPTLGAALDYVDTPVSKTITTQLTQYSVTMTPVYNAQNIIVAVWTDSQFSSNTLYIGQAGLYMGSIAPIWSPRPVQQELALCQRYYQNSANTGGILYGAGYATAGVGIASVYVFPTTMRATPIITSASETNTGMAAGGPATTKVSAVSFASYWAKDGSAGGYIWGLNHTVESEL